MLKSKNRSCSKCANAVVVYGSTNYRCNQDHINGLNDEISNIIIKTDNPNIYLNMIGLKVLNKEDAIGFPKSFKKDSVVVVNDNQKGSRLLSGCVYFTKPKKSFFRLFISLIQYIF